MPTSHLRSLHTPSAGTRTCYALITIFAIAGTAKSESFTGPGGPARGQLVATDEARMNYEGFGALNAAVLSTVWVNIPVGYNSQGGYVYADRSYNDRAWIGAGENGQGGSNSSIGAVAATAESETYTGPGNWGSRPGGFATAVINWIDNVRLVWRGIGPAPQTPRTLQANVAVLGTTDVSASGYFNDGFNYGNQSAAIIYGFNTRHFIAAGSGGSAGVVALSNQVTPVIGEWRSQNSGTRPLAISLEGLIEGDLTAGVDFSFGASAQTWASYGTSAADVSVMLKSLTLPGFAGLVTPEQEGWQLVFASGMVSPNAVPEIDPSSFGSAFTLVLGALGLLERRARAKAA